MQPYTLIPTLKLRMQWAARVCLSDCFALGGKGTGGLKTPGYSKTVLRTENAAAAPHHFGYRLFNNAGIRMQITDCFESRSGMVLRIIVLRPWSTIPRQKPARNTPQKST